jgi:thioredoxin-like negative regulator of GroEL
LKEVRIVEIWVFGREECPNCRLAKKNVGDFLEKNGINGSVRQVYYNMDTVDGLAEGAFNDVRSIPTTIVHDNGENIARWDGVVPPQEELSQKVSEG